ncbi:MAG: glutamate--tRNA ligase, partial [Acidobacteria bacterium]|nr:glutamate--tRNA ligase [Acidobacteriota bacterium]
YNLAVVCDDIEMQISDVVRGQDHLTNTHKQILIYEALGEAPPRFAHLPLILAPNKGKLSKRKHGAVVSLTTYRDAGFVAAAFRNFLALLGWSAGEEREIYNLEELIKKFSLEGIHRSNAVFNFQENDPRHWTDDKALWMNAEYIRTMPLEDLLPLVKDELKSAKLWREEYEDGDKAWFEKTVDLIRQRFFTLKDFSQQGRAFFSEDFDFDQAAIDKNLKKFPDLQAWLPELADRLETVEDFTHDNLETVVNQFAEEKGTKLGVIMNGARSVLTGLAVGPSMLAVFEALGKEKSVLRLKSQIAWNQ